VKPFAAVLPVSFVADLPDGRSDARSFLVLIAVLERFACFGSGSPPFPRAAGMALLGSSKSMGAVGAGGG
jgi:hypothetical protein